MPRSLAGPAIGLPRTVTAPIVGSSKPATMRNRVDLPQPEAPITHTSSPWPMVRSMRASASISPSPTAKRLVTPLSASRAGGARSAMVLRAPGEEMVADQHDDPVGDEAAGADHDHAGHDQVGARQGAAVHHHRAEPG